MLGFNPISSQPVSSVPTAGAANNYTLTAQSGSYSVSGQSANLTRSRLLTADFGIYAVTGQSATILRSKVLVADPGAYSVTGQQVGINVNRMLTASPGSYSIAGQSATITKTAAGAYTLTALSGSYDLTGQSATITYTPANVLEDTHDGYWHKQWAKLHQKKPKIEEVIELVQEMPATALAEVKEAVKREYPKVDYTQVLKNVELQRFIAQQLIKSLELRRIADDEEDIETLMLML